MIARAAAVIAVLVGMRVFTAHATVEMAVPRSPLATLPLRVAEWGGRDAPEFADDVVQQLGVDEYVNRIYVAPARTPIALYAGYYASQRQGDTIHSPRNCLPGAGWQPIQSSTIELGGGAAGGRANRILIQKGLDRQLVVYWYQGRGRVVANEYANKLWLMLDAATIHRTDGGLVRLIAPVANDTAAAGADLEAFATVLAPELARHMP